MSLQPENWLTRWRIWVPALVFFLLNGAGALAYSLVGIGDQANLEQQRLTSAKEREAQVTERSRQLRHQVDQILENQERIRVLYEERLSTHSQRLTQSIAELRQLARQAGLVPDRVSYPEQSLGDFGLIQKSFVFSVSGSYAELRRLINTLELTESFLTLEEIRLGGGSEGEELRISLRLSTLFTNETDETGAVGGSTL
jgi:DNA repair exonuclease SbcCD ATPase subunit